MGSACVSVRSVGPAAQVHPLGVVPSDVPKSSPSSEAPAGAGGATTAEKSEGPATTDTNAAANPAAVSTPTAAVGAGAGGPTPQKPKKTLIKAAKEGDAATTDELLRAGVDLEALGMWDNTPLLAACMYGHTEVALRLIEAKADVFARNEHSATPLHYAAVEGNQQMLEALLRAGGSAGAKMANCGAVRIYNRHLDNYAHRTPLASAAESGFLDACERLLEARAQVEEVHEEDGRTPLWLACRYSRKGVAKHLYEKRGADTTVQDKEGVSVLGAAVAGGCEEELVLGLLTHGIGDVNATAGSLLRDAARAGNRAVVQALLTHGALVNSATAAGATALHTACQKGDEHLITLLVRSRADPAQADNTGLTALDFLRRRGMKDDRVVALLSTTVAAGDDDGGTGGAGDGGTCGAGDTSALDLPVAVADIGAGVGVGAVEPAAVSTTSQGLGEATSGDANTAAPDASTVEVSSAGQAGADEAAATAADSGMDGSGSGAPP